MLCLVSWKRTFPGIGLTHSFIEQVGQVEASEVSRVSLKPQFFLRQGEQRTTRLDELLRGVPGFVEQVENGVALVELNGLALGRQPRQYCASKSKWSAGSPGTPADLSFSRVDEAMVEKSESVTVTWRS